MSINNNNNNVTPVRESVIVVMDSRCKSSSSSSKGNTDAIEWALQNVVRPKDTLLVLGVLCESFGSLNNNIKIKNNTDNHTSCFPFQFLMGIGISGIWERLEFAGQGELNAREIEGELQEKRAQYQTCLQPFYKQCRKMEVRLDVKLAAGFPAKILTVEEARNSNARWIVLDNHFKKDKLYISGHVNCNVALIKGKDLATLIPPKGTFETNNCQLRDFPKVEFDNKDISSSLPKTSPCWYPLSWRYEFPRQFSHKEIKAMTKGFFEEYILARDENDIKVYQGLFKENLVLVQCFSESDKRFLSMLKILTRIRHRNIANLVGYCSTKDLVSMIFDYPCKGTLATNLQCDDDAQKLGWKARWCIAQEIGASLRYLHEECLEGPIVHNSVCSSHVIFSHSFSTMLTNFTNAKWLKNVDPTMECLIQEEADHLCVDVHGYGIFLLELISGKSACNFLEQGDGQTLVDWGLPQLEKGIIRQVMDSRLDGSGDDTWMAHRMAHAALHCLQTDSTHKVSISEAIGLVRGDTLGTQSREI